MRKIDKKLNGTYEKILQTTIKLIQEEGSQKLTMKRVAEKAKVNKALVNYHFTGKENLIKEAVSVMSKDLWTVFDVLDNYELDARIRFEKFLINFLKQILKFKESIKYLLYEGKFLFDEQKQFSAYLKNIGLPKIKKTIFEIAGEKDNTIGDVLTLQIFGSLVLPNIIVTEKNDIFKFVLPNIEKQVQVLMERL